MSDNPSTTLTPRAAHDLNPRSTFGPFVASILSAGYLEIEEGFARRAFSSLLEDLMLLESGAPMTSLGYSERREALQPEIWQVSGAAPAKVASRRAIYDQNLTPDNSIALLKLRGVMRSNDGASSPGIESLTEDMWAAYDNPKISAIVVDVNSGGGESMAGRLLLSTVLDRNKPVVGYSHFAASAALHGMAAMDEIVGAGSSAQFGSIGTYVTVDLADLEFYKANFKEVYSKYSPKKNKVSRAMSEGDFGPLQDMVDKVAEQFRNDMMQYRSLKGTEAQIEDTLSGDMFDAAQAKKRGLIDMTGTLSTAMKRAMHLANRAKQ